VLRAQGDTVRPDKAAAVAELTDAFRDSSAAVLTEYRGLTVAQLKELRRSLAGNATYSVVKNTLTKIAARQAGVDTLEPLLEGPSAIAFVTGDPVVVAKSLRAFGREHPLLVVKGGVLDGRAITAEDVRKLADLESREVLLAKLAGAMKASLQQAVSLFAAPLSQAARLLGALEQQKSAEAPAADDDPVAAEPAPPADEATPVADEAPPADETPTADETPAAAEVPTEEQAAKATEAEPAADVAAPSETPAADAAAPSETPAADAAAPSETPAETDVAGDATSTS
jgi:large subunit ribosomal protein L10